VEGGVDLQEVKFGLLSAHHADGPHTPADGPRGGFQPAVRHVLRLFLRAFHLILFA
jgi:hypothetical protein